MLVDTNVLSELPRSRPNVKVIEWFAAQETIHLSVVTIEELAFGVAHAEKAARSKLADWFEALLESRPVILEVTAGIARASGEIRAWRESRGRRVAQADTLIAATALSHGLTLATRNTRDFEGCGVLLVNPFA